MDYRLVFDERRAAQAAAHLLKLSGGKSNYMKLMKLMYVADRDRLIAAGRPITGAWMVSMPYGPVLSEVLDLIKKGSLGPWSTLVSLPEGYDVTLLVEEPSNDALSKNDLRALVAAFEKYRDVEPFRIVDRLHAEDAPEWEDPNGSSIGIPVERIFRKHGVTEPQAEAFAEASKFLDAVASLQR